MGVSLQQAAKVIRRLIDRLERSDSLEEAYAREVLRQAVHLAEQRPTPQAPMAARAMVIRRSSILSLTGGAPEREVAVGSEFGSTIYRQFGPRNERGYWLLPAVANPDQGTIRVGDNWLEDAIKSAIRGFG